MNQRVLIVGAGITGMALARALNEKNIEHLILEKRQTPSDGGLAINLPGNAIAALNRLGVADEVVRFGRPIQRREYRTGTGRLLFQVDEDAFWGETMRPRAMLRRDLLRILAEGIPDTSILRGRSFATLEQKDDTISAALDVGLTIEAGLLVGADGVSSRVRDAIASGENGSKASRLGDASWRFMVPNPGVDCWTVFAAAGAVVLLMPVKGDEVYGWAMAEKAVDGQNPVVLENAFGLFPDVVRAAIASALSDPACLYHSPLVDVRPSRWSNGRIVLTGDAAHAMAPVWAQGAALGLEDAIVLAEELARSSDWTSAIQSYEARRKPRTAHVQNATDRMSRAAKLPNWLRNVAMPFVGPRSYTSTYTPLREWI